MSIVDIAISIIVLGSLLVGLFRGFIREILSLFSWLVSIWIAYRYASWGAVYLDPYFDQAVLRFVVAFAILFIVCLILFSMGSYLVYRLLAITGITGVDRSLGSLFGFARGVVIMALFILCARFMDFTSQPWWQESMLIHYFTPVTEFIRSLLPNDIAELVKPK